MNKLDDIRQWKAEKATLAATDVPKPPAENK